MTKYKEYFQRMLKENKDVFDKFTEVHFKYSADPDLHQDMFNKEGEKILKIAAEWENKLCSQSEKAGYANYTGGLAEKFQSELKVAFPLIDHVGIIAVRSTFKLKKLL